MVDPRAILIRALSGGDWRADAIAYIAATEPRGCPPDCAECATESEWDDEADHFRGARPGMVGGPVTSRRAA